jgi:RNA polymerase sigma factor (sigma-70 family)
MGTMKAMSRQQNQTVKRQDAGEFSGLVVDAPMAELDEPQALEPETGSGISADTGARGQSEPERIFAASIRKTRVLTRDEEIDLARQIVRARNRVRRVIRQARRITRRALSDAGRGVVLPESDFREREALRVLDYALAKLQSRTVLRGEGFTRRELRLFIAELTAALAEYRKVRDQMIEANVRLVSLLARQYRHATLSYLDMVQEGTIGLIRAIEKYEPDRGVKFSTYAVWWIWQQITRSVDNQGALIRTPVHWSQFRRRMDREAQRGAPEDASDADNFALGQGVAPERAAQMTQMFRFVSTDAPASDEDDRPLETVVGDAEKEPESQLLQNDLRAQLDEAITRLPAREAHILRERFGLRDDASQTLEELGTHFGVSRERIRQLESRALRQLRDVCAAQGLQDYLA